MEKCAKFVVDAAGQINHIVNEISCDIQTKTVYFEWNWWVIGVVFVFLIVVAIVLWNLIWAPKWNVWASQKQGEADLQQAHKEQQVQVASAQGRLDAAVINKNAAIIEAEAVSAQIERIGEKLTTHDLYLKWQWIKMMEEKPEGSVIYVPTEANLPILEAGMRNK